MAAVEWGYTPINGKTLKEWVRESTKTDSNPRGLSLDALLRQDVQRWRMWGDSIMIMAFVLKKRFTVCVYELIQGSFRIILRRIQRESLSRYRRVGWICFTTVSTMSL